MVEGKFVSVYYSDGSNINRKDGRCVRYDNLEIVLDTGVLIPRDRIVRVEMSQREDKKGWKN